MSTPDAEHVARPTQERRASSARTARRRAARLSPLFAIPLIFHTIAAATSPAAAAETWVPLFDGRTLAGWEGRTDVFRVEDGAIVAGSRTAPMPRNEFLCTLAEYGDFVLRLEFLMPGDGMNAGVQFRSRRIPDDHEVIGYQADMGDGWWGALYDESRRNRLLAKPDDEVIARVLDKGGWNQYVIDARGDHVRLFINDQMTVDYTEPDAAVEPRGRICLQIHGGPPGEVQYRNIEIRELAP
jgi:3-keto-disaccharide hydrolase